MSSSPSRSASPEGPFQGRSQSQTVGDATSPPQREDLEPLEYEEDFLGEGPSIAGEEDLMGDGMERDYRPMPELDRYDDEHSKLSVGDRLATEHDMRRRDREAGLGRRVDDDLIYDESDEDEAPARKRRMAEKAATGIFEDEKITMAQRKQSEKSEESSGFGFAAILGAAIFGGAVTYGLNQLLSDNSSSGSARESAYQRPNESRQRRVSSDRQRTFPSDFSFGSDPSAGRTDDPDLKTACGICWDKRPEIMMLPCNHVNLCRDCWEQFRVSRNGKTCITCRGEIQRIQRVYL